MKGALRMDAGAVRAVELRSKSLFSAGIVGASGDFSAQDAVQLCDAAGRELGRGLCNYSAAEVDKIKVGTPAPLAEVVQSMVSTLALLLRWFGSTNNTPASLQKHTRLGRHGLAMVLLLRVTTPNLRLDRLLLSERNHNTNVESVWLAAGRELKGLY